MIKTCTRGGWGVSTHHRGGDNFITLNVYKHHPAPHRNPRFISQHGDGDGLTFPNTDAGRQACDDYCILHGYLQPYSRNLTHFVSNRSFRKHTGKLSMPGNDYFYLLKRDRLSPAKAA